MRLISAATVVFVTTVLAICGFGAVRSAQRNATETQRVRDARVDGKRIFRFDTFGDEQLWTNVLRMHEVISSSVDPTTALAVGLKVDIDALPADVIAALR